MKDPTKTCEARVQIAEVVEVIRVTTLIGHGITADPMREIVTWWTKEGELIATDDAWAKQQRALAELAAREEST